MTLFLYQEPDNLVFKGPDTLLEGKKRALIKVNFFVVGTPLCATNVEAECGILDFIEQTRR